MGFSSKRGRRRRVAGRGANDAEEDADAGGRAGAESEADGEGACVEGEVGDDEARVGEVGEGYLGDVLFAAVGMGCEEAQLSGAVLGAQEEERHRRGGGVGRELEDCEVVASVRAGEGNLDERVADGGGGGGAAEQGGVQAVADRERHQVALELLCRHQVVPQQHGLAGGRGQGERGR